MESICDGKNKDDSVTSASSTHDSQRGCAKNRDQYQLSMAELQKGSDNKIASQVFLTIFVCGSQVCVPVALATVCSLQG